MIQLTTKRLLVFGKSSLQLFWTNIYRVLWCRSKVLLKSRANKQCHTLYSQHLREEKSGYKEDFLSVCWVKVVSRWTIHKPTSLWFGVCFGCGKLLKPIRIYLLKKSTINFRKFDCSAESFYSSMKIFYPLQALICNLLAIDSRKLPIQKD